MSWLVISWFLAVGFISCESPQRTQYIRQEVVYRIEVTGGDKQAVGLEAVIGGVCYQERASLPWVYTFDAVTSLTEEGTDETYCPSVNWERLIVTSYEESSITIQYYRGDELLMESESVYAYYDDGNLLVNMCIMVNIMVGPIISRR